MSVVKTATREEISPQVHIDPTHRLYKALDFNYVIFPVSLGVLFFRKLRLCHVMASFSNDTFPASRVQGHTRGWILRFHCLGEQ